jgi:hypothetical protein
MSHSLPALGLDVGEGQVKPQFHASAHGLPLRCPWFQLGRRVGGPYVLSEHGVKERDTRL